MHHISLESHRVAQDLRRQILGGEYMPGDKLPTEQSLCDRFGVSRVTVREGLRILQDQALIHRRQGSGSFVSAMTRRHIPLVHGGYFKSVRPYLDKLDRRVESMRWIEADAEVASTLQVAPGQSVLWAQRLDILAGEPVAMDELWLEGSVATRVTRRHLQQLGFFDRWQEVQQVAVEYVQQAVEAAAAPAPVRRTLKLRSGKPVLKETCIAHMTTQRPGGLFVTHYRHDVFRLESVVRHCSKVGPTDREPS